MSTTTVLRDYAQIANPEDIPIAIRLSYTEKSVAIFDAYPKALFHILILPRIVPPLNVSDLGNLRNLLCSNKERAKEVLFELAEHAKHVKALIEEEMMVRYGFKWDIWTGFHAVPSLVHVHLHVISHDLCGSALKTKRNYNTFHPKLGFFLHLNQVLEWFDAESSFYDAMSKLDPKQYEPFTKEDLVCWRCDRSMKNMPTLVEHLWEDWRDEAKRTKAKDSRRQQKSAKEDTGSGSRSDTTDAMQVDSD